mgnify:CR=1 FL=1
MTDQMPRRKAIHTMITSSTILGYTNLGFTNLNTTINEADNDIAKVAKYVHPKVSWSYAEFNEFLDLLPDTGLISLQKSLELISDNTNQKTVKDRDEVVNKIQTQLLWYSSNILTYPFEDEEKIGYHNLTKWVGGELGVDQWILDTQPTLVVERAIQEKLFVDIWDKLSVEQRTEVLKKVDKNGDVSSHATETSLDYAAIASLSGAGALAALSMTVHLVGFTFYTTMSTVICATAGFFGVTLPFAAYTTSSSFVAFLSGPVGWALLAIAAAAGVTLAGRANPRKTAAAICQIHSLKVAALKASNSREDNLFTAMGDPLKRQLVGRWRIHRKKELIDLNLESDGVFTAKCFRPPVSKEADIEQLWEGKGEWKIRDKGLFIKRTHTWHGIYWSENKRNLYDGQNILEIKPTLVRLAEKATLTRI